MIFAGLRGILDGTVQPEALPQRMDVMNRRIESLLESHGFPRDYLEPVYRCSLCKDTGYVGEPVKEMCSCLRNAYYTRLYQKVGLTDPQEQSFERFDETIFPDEPLPTLPFSQRQVMGMNRIACEQYADTYPKETVMNMLLTGQSGLGKTFLMHAMAKRLLDRGLNVLMVSAYRFLEIARKAYFTNNTEELDSLMDTDVLLLDDLGTEPLLDNVTVTQVFNLINERQSRGRGLIISTNLSEKEIRDRYTERVASRLTDKRLCRIIPFVGDDVRRL